MAEVMQERELKIYALLEEADEFAYVPEDKSDLYALAPDTMAPGLIRIPGEYSTMNEVQIQNWIQLALESGNWQYIPLSTFIQ